MVPFSPRPEGCTFVTAYRELPETVKSVDEASVSI
jgi:hypothetical protein